MRLDGRCLAFLVIVPLLYALHTEALTAVEMVVDVVKSLVPTGDAINGEVDMTDTESTPELGLMVPEDTLTIHCSLKTLSLHVMDTGKVGASTFMGECDLVANLTL
jgi:hypothetical protein